MAFDLVKRMIGRKREEEVNVAEKVFGNIDKFRVGSSISISGHILDLFPEGTLFGTANNADYSSLIVETILSFTFDGQKFWRLYCTPIGSGEDCIIQIQEGAKGEAFYMIFLLTQEEGVTEQDSVDAWMEFMDQETIPYSLSESNTVEYTKLFGPLSYDETVEIDGNDIDRPASCKKVMSLYEHEVDGEIEYILFDFNKDDWYLEGFAGINIPREEITIS